MSNILRSKLWRFLLCLAVAFFVIPLSPGGGIGPQRYGRYDPGPFFALAFQMAAVILLATALYAGVLFVEHVWRWRRRSREAGKDGGVYVIVGGLGPRKPPEAPKE